MADVIAGRDDVEAELFGSPRRGDGIRRVVTGDLEPEPDGPAHSISCAPRRHAATTRATTATISGTTMPTAREKSARSRSAPVRSTRIERVYLRSANRATPGPACAMKPSQIRM